MTAAPPDIHDSGPNVFADLELADAEVHLAKARIAARLRQVMEEQELTLAHAAKLAHVSRIELSGILRGRLRPFTLEKLERILLVLERDEEVERWLREDVAPTYDRVMADIEGTTVSAGEAFRRLKAPRTGPKA